MPKIKYEFDDGTSCEVEVNDELYAVHTQLLQEEKRNHWKNTRWHISLSYLNDYEIDIEDDGGSPLDNLVMKEDETAFHIILSSALRPKQIEVLEMIFDGMSVTEIARLKGVSQQAISKQLKTILKRLKLFSEKGCNLLSPVLIGGGTKSAYYVLGGLRK